MKNYKSKLANAILEYRADSIDKLFDVEVEVLKGFYEKYKKTNLEISRDYVSSYEPLYDRHIWRLQLVIIVKSSYYEN